MHLHLLIKKEKGKQNATQRQLIIVKDNRKKQILVPIFIVHKISHGKETVFPFFFDETGGGFPLLIIY
jgi:hypothetical protein